jgi:hypothetical protein
VIGRCKYRLHHLNVYQRSNRSSRPQRGPVCDKEVSYTQLSAQQPRQLSTDQFPRRRRPNHRRRRQGNSSTWCVQPPEGTDTRPTTETSSWPFGATTRIRHRHWSLGAGSQCHIRTASLVINELAANTYSWCRFTARQ